MFLNTMFFFFTPANEGHFEFGLHLTNVEGGIAFANDHDKV